MKRRFGFKKSLRQQATASLAAQRFMALGAPPENQVSAQAEIDRQAAMIKPLRARAAPTPSNEPTEADIQRAILDLLRQHPKVAIVGRFNRGVVQSSYQGRESYVRFNSIRGFPDIHGLLKGGRALYVEVKRPGQKPTEDQADFLEHATKAGALAFVATSVDEVARALA